MASGTIRFVGLCGVAAVAAAGAIVVGDLPRREVALAEARVTPLAEAATALPAEARSAAAGPRAWPDAPLPPEVSGAQVVLALHRIGLDPSTLAASGVDVPGAGAAVAATADALASFGPALAQADASVASARALADSMRGRVVGGLASEEEIDEWTSARAAAGAAAAARTAVLDQLFALAAAPLSGDARAAAATARAAAVFREDVPAAYRVVERSAESLVALRDALAAERIALSREREVPAEVAALLSAVRSEAAVSAALSSAAANEFVIAQTWAAESVAPPGQ